MQSTQPTGESNRFRLLLLSLLLYVLATPMVSLTDYALPVQVLAFILLGAILISAIWTMGKNVASKWILAAVAIAAAILNAASLLFEHFGFQIAFHFTMIAFLAGVAVIALNHLLHSRSVSYETIAAALCVYVLLIVAWSNGYQLMELVMPGSFSLLGETAGPNGMSRFGAGQGSLALYYSFVTMTTLGYGDITPLNDVARMSAAMQAFIGQVYIAVLVARLVGLQITQVTTNGDRQR